ncbi:hypothetical protein HPP92_005805 [Vanilla planifolia]|uniref:Uncharacterized protein n=1 Tax=Vanilla planifolia TaxID=51239 RepID=A0A835RMD6_VANPL|nr:hypothetical protein HPP92_005805 [Vanilla planifolia]
MRHLANSMKRYHCAHGELDRTSRSSQLENCGRHGKLKKGTLDVLLRVIRTFEKLRLGSIFEWEKLQKRIVQLENLEAERKRKAATSVRHQEPSKRRAPTWFLRHGCCSLSKQCRHVELFRGA